MPITCPLCPGIQLPSIRTFIKHLRITHADDPNFHIQCNLQGCRRTFKNLKHYLNHIYSRHDLLGDHPVVPVHSTENSSQPPLQPATVNYDYDNNSYSSDNSENSDVVDDESGSFDISKEDVQRAAAIWILKSRECHCIPMSVMDQVIFDVQSLFNVTTDHVHKNFESVLRSHEVPENVIRAVLSDVQRSTPIIFQGLETQHKQQSYFKAHLNLVVSTDNVDPCNGILYVYR